MCRLVSGTLTRDKHQSYLSIVYMGQKEHLWPTSACLCHAASHFRVMQKLECFCSQLEKWANTEVARSCPVCAGHKQGLWVIKDPLERNTVPCFVKLRPPCLQQDTNTQTHTKMSSALHLSWVLTLILLNYSLFRKKLSKNFTSADKAWIQDFHKYYLFKKFKEWE